MQFRPLPHMTSTNYLWNQVLAQPECPYTANEQAKEFLEKFSTKPRLQPWETDPNAWKRS